MKGQEERDNHFGRIFGLASILRSGRCCGDDADPEVLSDIVARLVDLSGKKSYFREPCFQVCVGVALFREVRPMICCARQHVWEK